MSKDEVPAPGADRYAVIGVFETIGEAIAVVPDVVAAGIDRDTISLLGLKDATDARHAPGGSRSPSAERIADTVGDAATIDIRGVGPVVIGGWLAAKVRGDVGETPTSSLEHLRFVGVPTDRIEDHRESVIAGRGLLIVHGDLDAIKVGYEALEETTAQEVVSYAPGG